MAGPDESGNDSVELLGRMKGLSPAPDRQDFHVDRWNEGDRDRAPGQLARVAFAFVGTVYCEPFLTRRLSICTHTNLHLLRPFNLWTVFWNMASGDIAHVLNPLSKL